METKALRQISTLLSEATQFTNLEEDDRARLATYTRELDLQRGEKLFHRGDPCTGIHIVISGQLKLAVISNAGKEKIVELVGPGQMIGADSIFSTRFHSVFAEALSDCHLLHISQSGIENELKGVSKVGQGLLCALAERSQHFVEEVEAYSLNTGKERVISFFLNELHGVSPDRDEAVLHLSAHKGVIASLLNLTQEHFSRILHELQANELIKVDCRFIGIPSICNLRAELTCSARSERI